MPDVIPLGQPTVGDEEIAAIAEVFKSGWLAGNGPMSRKFEAAFAKVAGADHALATSNCTNALHLAFHGLKASPGDEVIVADYTFPATGHGVMYTGATPIFADVLPDTGLVDPASVEAKITDKTVGIATVDTAGQCADYDALEAIAKKNGLFLVEDAAPAAGATYKDRPAGSFGDAACFSFHGRKGITAGEGGALTTKHADLDASARKLHAFGITSALDRAEGGDLPIPEFDELGFNYKMSDIAAAIMLVQLGRLDGLIERRNQIAAQYNELLTDCDLVQLPTIAPGNLHTWQAYILTLDESVNRGPLAKELREAGVQCNIGTYASHVQPLYGEQEPLPVSADLFRRHFTIPMHANLTDDQIERAATTLIKALENNRS